MLTAESKCDQFCLSTRMMVDESNSKCVTLPKVPDEEQNSGTTELTIN